MDSDNKKPIFIGYHGTNNVNSNPILKNNFNVSDKDEWIGDGAYFFVEGLSCPKKSAKEWAISRSNRYDKNTKKYKTSYPEYSVIEAIISTDMDKVIDLSSTDGKKGYFEYKEKFLKSACDRGKKLKAGKEGLIINNLCRQYECDVVISELAIKTSEYEFKQKVSNVISNKTVLAVRNPTSCIELKNISISCTGDIEVWT